MPTLSPPLRIYFNLRFIVTFWADMKLFWPKLLHIFFLSRAFNCQYRDEIIFVLSKAGKLSCEIVFIVSQFMNKFKCISKFKLATLYIMPAKNLYELELKLFVLRIELNFLLVAPPWCFVSLSGLIGSYECKLAQLKQSQWVEAVFIYTV